jgi:hypothetical protein
MAGSLISSYISYLRHLPLRLHCSLRHPAQETKEELPGRLQEREGTHLRDKHLHGRLLGGKSVLQHYV